MLRHTNLAIVWVALGIPLVPGGTLTYFPAV